MPAVTIADLNNAKLDLDHIAALATSTAPTATDRLGNVKKTLSYAIATVDTAVAQNAAGAASIAKAAAEAARDAALIQAGVYATEAAGRAAVADGQAFKVQGAGEVAAYEYRRTNSTTSVLIATYPSAARVNAIGNSPGVFEAAALTFKSSQLAAGTKTANRTPFGGFCAWANAVTYSGQSFDIVTLELCIANADVPLKLTIRNGDNFNTVISTAYASAKANGVQTFILPKRLTNADLTSTAGCIWIAVESINSTNLIIPPITTQTASHADQTANKAKYQNSSLLWTSVDTAGSYLFPVVLYDSTVDLKPVSALAADVAKNAATIDAVKKNGRLTPYSTEARIATPSATSKFNVNSTYSVRSWQVRIPIYTPKIVNSVSIPIVKNWFGGGNAFTQPILIRIAKNNTWIKDITLSVADLAPYNALVIGDSPDKFDYYADIPDTELAAGDSLYVAWECGAADLMSMLYQAALFPGTEGLEGRHVKSTTAGLLAGLATPTAIASAGDSFYIRVQSWYKSYLRIAPEVPLVTLAPLSPKKVYTVQNDLANGDKSARQNAVPLYLDHCVSGFTAEPDLRFVESGTDKVMLASPQNWDNGVSTTFPNVATSAKTFTIRGPLHNDAAVTVEHKSVKESVARSKTIIGLTIGDSVTDGHLADMNVPANGPTQYWTWIKEELEKARIDYGDSANDFNCVMIGRAKVRNWNLSYGNVVNRPLTAGTEGRGGWAMTTHLHWSRNWSGGPGGATQGLWDLLGLGSGTGTDYTGSTAQKTTLNTTPEGKNAPTNTAAFIAYIKAELGGNPADYSAAVALLDAKQADPENPFYNKATAVATDHAFSLATYLARYKTLANDGKTRLTVGSTAGSKVTNAAAYDVCVPTHIILQHSHNDGDSAWVGTNYRIMTNAVKAEYTANGWGSVHIGISIVAFTGTFFPSRYTDFENASVALWRNGAPYMTGYKNQERVFTEFWKGSANEDTEKIFLLPTYHVQPTAYSTPYRHVPSPESFITGLTQHSYKVMNGAGPTWHPNGIANRVWAAAMYGWLVYTCSL